MSCANLSFSLKNAVFSASLTILVFFALEAKSSHMAGAELSYQYIDADYYKVNYTLYADCSGSLPPASVNMMIRSESCSLNTIYTLSLVPGSEIEISTNCSSSPSTCNGGSSTGYKQLKYTGTILLTEKCNDIVFSVTDCCRNSAITSIISPETQALYVEAYLDNISGPNNSPVFDSKPILVLSAHQINLLSESAIDADGDSLAYSLIAPKNSEITNVNFANGFTAEQFISTETPINFNPENGTISITPSGIETAILAIKVTEFRNGRSIGSTMRDIQMISAGSSNHLPSIQQLDALSSSIYKLCIGDDLIINMSSVDLDAGQQNSIEIYSNITGLSITKSTDLLQKAQIKWKADSTTSTNRNLWIKIIVTDNACPINGVKTYFLEVKVSELNISSTVTNSECAGKNNGSIITGISGNQIVEYSWEHSNSNQSFATNLSAGIYNLSVNNFNGCIVKKTFRITNLETISAEISSISSSCGTANGKAEVLINGGIQPYQCNWSDGINSVDRNDLPKGNYSIEVTDQIGCRISATLTIESQVCDLIDSRFKLFPNPAANQITLKNDYLTSSVTSIIIVDISGKIVYNSEREITDNLMTTIDVSDFSNGIYLVKITTIKESTTLPFVKL
ncbi:MAG: T9SS type A sorting domain-containing protein [Bacteroidetes bacterium]|nr:T9SS type A sorting domain-containing protein [Bacteroidota bacterium]